MWTHVILIGGFLSLLGLVVLLASKSGSKAAQLEVLKQEIRKRAEEQARAQKILDSVANMSNDDVRNKLHGIASSVNKK